MGKLLTATHDVAYLNATQLADSAQLTRAHFDLLVLPYGETFPAPAKETMLAFLADGGDLLSTGGYAFQSPVVQQNGAWRFIADMLAQAPAGENLPARATGWAGTLARHRLRQHCTHRNPRATAAAIRRLAL